MKNITQEKMARFIGVSPQYFSDIKQNKRSLGKKSALRICREGKASKEDAFSLQNATGDEFVNLVKRLMLVAQHKEQSK